MKSTGLPIVYFARHGQTVLNAEGRFRGNKNPELSPKGLRDAHHLKTLFSEIPLSFIMSSDKIRAEQTAKIIQEGQNVPREATPSFRALDVGSFSGALRNKENTEALQRYIEDPELIIPGGESLNEFRARIQPAIWEVFDMADEAGLPALIVAHSSVIHELGNLVWGQHDATLVEPGGVAVMYVRNGRVGAEPIFKPAIISEQEKGKADTISK